MECDLKFHCCMVFRVKPEKSQISESGQQAVSFGSNTKARTLLLMHFKLPDPRFSLLQFALISHKQMLIGNSCIFHCY